MKSNKETTGDVSVTVVTIDGIEYLVMPEAIEYSQLERGAIQQRINRDRKPNKLGVKRIKNTKYVFIPYDLCKEWRNGAVKDELTEKLKELATLDLTVEDIQKMIEDRKSIIGKGKKK